ncbi:MAG: carboxypeptidase-like regulatory domain-containing protein, partial [Bacteroidota bacterium]
MKHLFTAIACLFLLLGAHSQTIVTGRVIKASTGSPIPYANIGILNSEIGTISNVDGTFSLKIPDKHQEDDLLISSLGFDIASLP